MTKFAMSESERHAAIKQAIEAYTAANTVTREAARAALVREGIYTESGHLRPEFGGEPERTKAAK